MNLTYEECEQFFGIQASLMHFVNRQCKISPKPVSSYKDFPLLAPEVRHKVHSAFLENPKLLEEFLEKNPDKLSPEDLEIASSWRHFVTGQFFILQDLKKHTIFLSEGTPSIAYGVLALFEPLDSVIGPNRPKMVQTTLLPYKGRIVYDGLMASYPIHFGPGVRRATKEWLQEAKSRFGIVTSLPFSVKADPEDTEDLEPPTRPKTARKKEPKPAKSPVKLDEQLEKILNLLGLFCEEFLEERFYFPCEKIAIQLARKDPSPLLKGGPRTWAGGIIQVLSWVNSLEDVKSDPDMPFEDIYSLFEISGKTCNARFDAICDLLKVKPADPRFLVPRN